MTIRISSPIELDDIARAGLAQILDVILPGTERLPAGRSLRVHEELLDGVLRADPSLNAPLVAAGMFAAAADDCTLEALTQRLGEDLERVVFALTAAYYMSSEVRDAVGYPGQRRLPIAQATSEERASDELLAPVIGRGPIYIPTPE